MSDYLENLCKVQNAIQEIGDLKNAGHELMIQKHILSSIKALLEIADHHEIPIIDVYVEQMIDNRRAKKRG